MKGIIPISIYGNVVGDKKLGSFSYFEIDGTPDEIRGQFKNGTGYHSYLESYYFASSGNYRTFFFANLTYGLWDAEFNLANPTLDDELKKNPPRMIESDFDFNRKKSYPSTFGVIGRNVDSEDIFNILHAWSALDYHSLNKDLMQ